jgi:hypothetical protein
MEDMNMKINVVLKPRTGSSFAEGIYDGKTLMVLKGGKISDDFAAHIRGGKIAKTYREDKLFVDENHCIIKECVFSSPSTAAQFVTGRSTNGYEAWKVEFKKSLGDYLKEKGLR